MSRLVDPKIVLANERTYLAWVKMAATIGLLAAGLLGASDDSSRKHAELLHPEDDPGAQLTWWIGIILMPVGLMFAIYAAVVYRARHSKIIRMDLDDMTEETIPLLMGASLGAALGLILVADSAFSPIIKLKA
mmetsp:Transcript_14436/g.25857  ORF Transcript_14436/g.25857 Transcript_14436/m.25857 type:complete len:133 (-) Transcript_14436:23-421(-)|eukprot:CAMPEP_0184551002 /NCGR_PEP_ID=MMETSP0199_2-20130426/23109_1 /TAXON_ID=1112570 /ORGANISM="Thraustochytrium sp., Strain LLF1b" /LENGTH=132 /DNA_ID=CAMNT_0026946035 /DNA_START=65 /DNA_END=463 /DNA_ORIENTATION=+